MDLQVLRGIEAALVIQQQALQHAIQMVNVLMQAEPRPRAEKLIWVRPWILRREEYGYYDNLMQELQAEDPSAYKNFVRIDADFFYEILHRIEARITRKASNYRKALDPGLMLAITLRYVCF